MQANAYSQALVMLHLSGTVTYSLIFFAHYLVQHVILVCKSYRSQKHLMYVVIPKPLQQVFIKFIILTSTWDCLFWRRLNALHFFLWLLTSYIWYSANNSHKHLGNLFYKSTQSFGVKMISGNLMRTTSLDLSHTFSVMEKHNLTVVYILELMHCQNV